MSTEDVCDHSTSMPVCAGCGAELPDLIESDSIKRSMQRIADALERLAPKPPERDPELPPIPVLEPRMYP